MTSRQKAKTYKASEDESDDDEDEFLVFGTALPPLKEAEIDEDGKITGLRPRQFVWEQPVLDARGRALRFHGAFTGGFSAGYFNSVGSKEGWTPTTFVSRKTAGAAAGAGANASNSKPEDFMDAEDFTEHGIAARRVHMTAQFDDSLARLQLKRSMGASVIPDDGMLRDLIIPVQLSVGEKLMRHLGWKSGQGVGCNVKPAKVYGCSFAPPVSEEEKEDKDESVDSPPKIPDIAPVFMTGKKDSKGLGYSGFTDTGIFSNRVVLASQDLLPDGQVRRIGIRGQAFGVGALEREDEDIYAQEGMDRYDRQLGGTDDSGDRLHGWTAPRGNAATSSSFYQGHLLEGFLLAHTNIDMLQLASQRYLAPVIPKSFNGIHNRTTTPTVVTATLPQVQEATSFTSNRKPLDAMSRSEILEPKASPDIKSIFDLISVEDRDRLSAQRHLLEDASLTASIQSDKVGSILRQLRGGSDSNPPAAGPPSASSRWDKKPSCNSNDEAMTKPDRSKPLYSGGLFQPFAADNEKQSRFDSFQRWQRQAVSDPYSHVAPTSFTSWEQEREREEFVRAAALYRPVEGLLGQRFTHGEESELSSVKLGGLCNDPSKMTKEEETERERAVRLKLYGPLTRETLEWHPHNVLCRRFNVPNPYKDSQVVGVPQDRPKHDRFSVFDMLSLPKPIDFLQHHVEQQLPLQVQESVEKELVVQDDQVKKRTAAKALFASLFEEIANEESLKAVDEAENMVQAFVEPQQDAPKTEEEKDPLTDRPSIDIFKAIFADDESEPSSASDNEIEIDEVLLLPSIGNASIAPEKLESTKACASEVENPVVAPKCNEPSNRRMIAASSLFAHLFEDMSSSPGVLDHRVQDSQPIRTSTAPPLLELPRDVYGPVLPPNYVPDDFAPAFDIARVTTKVKDKEDTKKGKSKKKKKKKVKVKKEKKKEKHKKKRYSSSDSSDSVSDVDVVQLHNRIAALRY